jgi:hypothetical protein
MLPRDMRGGALSTVLLRAILKPYTLTDTTVQEMITKHSERVNKIQLEESTHPNNQITNSPCCELNSINSSVGVAWVSKRATTPFDWHHPAHPG